MSYTKKNFIYNNKHVIEEYLLEYFSIISIQIQSDVSVILIVDNSLFFSISYTYTQFTVMWYNNPRNCFWAYSMVLEEYHVWFHPYGVSCRRQRNI